MASRTASDVQGSDAGASGFDGGGVGIDVFAVVVVVVVVSGSKSLMRSSKESTVEETSEIFVQCTEIG